MTETRFDELLIFVFLAPGLLLLVWAFVSRQFQGVEAAKYRMMEGEEGGAASAVAAAAGARASRMKRRIFFTFFVAFFLFVTICPWLVFFFMAMSAAHAGGHGPAGSLVCPFQ